MQNDDDEGYGQVDGDFSAPARFVPYQTASAGQPWLRNPMPPWHLWGDSEIVTLPNASGNTDPGKTQQLIRISYKRPETWHWLFSASIIQAPDAAAAQQAAVFVAFDLIAGIGRASQVIQSFETFAWQWNGPINAPVNQVIFSTQVRGPNRVLASPVPAVPIDNVISEITAQDIQLSARVLVGFTGGLTGTVKVQVNAHFAPKTHIRPDWHMDRTPAEAKFAGAEIEGR